MTFSSDAI